ncbi:MAG: hypothetical protein EVA65_01425 [Oceanococcus sp.]|nr:MAG: hypothetical protein EVA65_01425 [Oceanococcus sp.]
MLNLDKHRLSALRQRQGHQRAFGQGLRFGVTQAAVEPDHLIAHQQHAANASMLGLLAQIKRRHLARLLGQRGLKHGGRAFIQGGPGVRRCCQPGSGQQHVHKP